MKRTKPRFGEALTALAIAAGILLGAWGLAEGLRASELYSGSRFLGEVLAGDAVELRELASDLENVNTLFKFAGAVTSAYIDFELIPVGEADTFAAVLESRPGSIGIDRFQYHGRNLSIYGTAPDREACDEFIRRLTDTGRFGGVSGDSEAAGGGVSFRIDALAQGG